MKVRMTNILNDDTIDEEGEVLGHNELEGKKKAVKESYERLHRLATNTHQKEFSESKVEG